MVELSTNTICFEGIQRIYRNAVVDHIRVTLGAKYPDTWESSISQLLGKEWETIVANANAPRNTGVVSTPVKDAADYLSVNHFHNVFEKYFEDLFPNDQDMPEKDRKGLRTNILGQAQQITEVRNPSLGHPAEVDMTIREALRMLDAAEYIVRHIDQDAARGIEKLWDDIASNEYAGVIPARAVEARTLPSRETIVPKFIGMQAELDELDTWFKDPYSSAWLIAGDGGKGKTAIAYEFTVSILEKPPPELKIVIWLSAKAKRFASGKSVDVEDRDFTDLDSAIDGVLRAYSEMDGVLQAYGERELEGKDISNKEEECRYYLSEFPALIIFDDVDSLEDRDLKDIMEYFVHRNRGSRAKILLTSRRLGSSATDPLARPHTQVKGFEQSSQEGRDFVNSCIRMYRLEEAQFPLEIQNEILQDCEGSPLFIQDLLRMCKVGISARMALATWKGRGGAEARKYALGRELENLDEKGAANSVLLSCALYKGPVSRSMIKAISEISDKRLNDAVTELQNLFLIPNARMVNGVETFSLNDNTSRLVLDVLGTDPLAEAIKSKIKEFSSDIPEQDHNLAYRQTRNAYRQVKADNHEAAEETLLEGLRLFPQEFGLLHSWLGWVYKQWKPYPRYVDAEENFSKAADFGCSEEETYLHWCGMMATQGKWSKSAEAAERGLEVIGKSPILSHWAGSARSQLAKALLEQTQYERAEQEAKKAESHLKNALLEGAYQSQSQVYRNLVLNYERQVRILQRQLWPQGRSDEGRLLQLMAQSLDRWRNEHPDAEDASSERERLLRWFPSLSDYLNG